MAYKQPSRAKLRENGLGVVAFETPSVGDTVTIARLDGSHPLKGEVVRRSLDGSAVWCKIDTYRTPRMFTYRAAIHAFREFPEQKKHGNLTVGQNGW